jgi:hypothetical protein
MGDRFSSRNKDNKREQEQPLLVSNEGKKGSRSGTWWLYEKGTSESKEAKIQNVNDSPRDSGIELPELKSKLLKPTKSALKSFNNISDRLNQVTGSYPVTDSVHEIIRGILNKINNNGELGEHTNFIKEVGGYIKKGVGILEKDIKKFNSHISEIKKEKNNLLLVVNDSGKRDMIEKLVNLPDLSNVHKSILDNSKRENHLQLMKDYISCIDVFKNQEYKQHLSDLEQLLKNRK